MVIAPAVEIRPIELPLKLTNQRAPSEPSVIPIGERCLGRCSWSRHRRSEIRPIELSPLLVNHRAPSGPAVIPSGPLMLGSV